jgi:DNA-binding NtrC family response regulator
MSMQPGTVEDSPAPSTVLVVEDDAALADLLGFMLTGAGHHPLSAADRGTAMQLARSYPEISIALCDLGLPPRPNQVDEGITLIGQLLQLRPQFKIIVVTGQDQQAAALAAIRAGAFDFLAKPVAPAQVLAAVERARLFVRTEADLLEAGESRITIAAKLEEGIREAGEAAAERLLRQVLADTGFNVAESARRLGLQRENLYYFIKKFGIQRDA